MDIGVPLGTHTFLSRFALHRVLLTALPMMGLTFVGPAVTVPTAMTGLAEVAMITLPDFSLALFMTHGLAAMTRGLLGSGPAGLM